VTFAEEACKFQLIIHVGNHGYYLQVNKSGNHGNCCNHLGHRKNDSHGGGPKLKFVEITKGQKKRMEDLTKSGMSSSDVVHYMQHNEIANVSRHQVRFLTQRLVLGDDYQESTSGNIQSADKVRYLCLGWKAMRQNPEGVSKKFRALAFRLQQSGHRKIILPFTLTLLLLSFQSIEGLDWSQRK
jgi:hypothetical protein